TFHYPPPTSLYTLSLHDALPISSWSSCFPGFCRAYVTKSLPSMLRMPKGAKHWPESGQSFASVGSVKDAKRWNSSSNISTVPKRSEEHTSELQSRGHLVCRLLLE